MTKRLLLLLPAAIAGAGCAQSAARPDPAVPAVKAPALEYRSAFEGYQAFADDKIRPWRDANETVTGGADHAGHGAKPADPKPPAKGGR
jgi:hypothetical protein